MKNSNIMKNSSILSGMLITCILLIFLSGFSDSSKGVLTYFKNMKLNSVKSCTIEIVHSYSDIKKQLGKKDLLTLTKLLNKCSSVAEGGFGFPKGDPKYLHLNMKSGEQIGFILVQDCCEFEYKKKQYNITESNVVKFFNYLIKKYDV